MSEETRPTAIVGGTVVTPEGRIESGVVVLDGDRIAAVGSAAGVALPADAERIGATGLTVVPGFVDVHVHGLLGHDLMGPGLAAGIEALPRFGVTSFLATTITRPFDETLVALRAMSAVIADPPPGARCLGVHAEGPFLSPARPGMAVAAWLEPISRDAVERLRDASGDRLRMITLAPEAGDGLAVIPWLVETGVVASIGHSDATFDVAKEAIRRGATHATHLFNAMPPFHHRRPGVVGAVLASDGVFAELIADGIHLHPATIEVALRAKGVDRTLLVSDAAPVAGLPDGSYRWGSQEIAVHDGRCELADGTIAGAHALQVDGFRRLVQLHRLPLHEAVRTVTATPAASIGREDLGRLEPGLAADVVLLDADLRPVRTIVAGRTVWAA